MVGAFPSEGLPAPVRSAKAFLELFARNRARSSARSDNLARAVERLGPSYVKMGQFLATRPDVIGPEFAADLALLQDRMATFPMEQSIAQIEGSLGRKADDLFAHLYNPVAAASVAQVHPAEIVVDGVERKVAVKVIRPGVRQRFAAIWRPCISWPRCRNGSCRNQSGCAPSR